MAKPKKRKYHRRPVAATARKHVLDKAAEAVLKSRQAIYSGPEQNFERIVRLWNAHLLNRFDSAQAILTPADVAIFNILLRVGRLAQTPTHLDSWIDIAGYGACGAEVAK